MVNAGGSRKYILERLVIVSSTPIVPDADLVREIAGFLSECGYTEAAMRKHGLTQPPWRRSPIQALLAHKIPDNPKLAMLVRLFHFGEAVEWQGVSSILPGHILEKMAACGMVRREGALVLPECRLTHFGELILACDSVRRLQTDDAGDLVLGVSPSTQFVARCLITRDNSETLDLGSGCGALALMLSPSSAVVCASDINARALAFTEFNAALNGRANVTVKCGDRFDAVQNERFDLIACNPPFFLNPKPRLLYTDNPFELDSMVGGLSRAAPKFLKEMGFFQMLCEWVECGGESWKDRLSGWFSDSGCDVLVLKAYEVAAVDYTLKRVAEAATMHPEENEDSVRGRLEYFDHKGVSKVFGGLVTMRRRGGKNWIVFEEMDDAPTQSIGSVLLEHFHTLDVLMSEEKDKLRRMRPRVSKGVRLMRQAVQEGRAWKATKIYLERPEGLGRPIGFESDIAELIGRFDGKQTMEAIVTKIASEKKLPATKVADVVLQVVTDLASRGFVEFPDE